MIKEKEFSLVEVENFAGIETLTTADFDWRRVDPL